MTPWLKVTPPVWMRHITPWWLLYWLDKRLPTCWTVMVLWKMYGDEDSWWPLGKCFAAYSGERYDYCGKFSVNDEETVTR